MEQGAILFMRLMRRWLFVFDAVFYIAAVKNFIMLPAASRKKAAGS